MAGDDDGKAFTTENTEDTEKGKNMDGQAASELFKRADEMFARMDQMFASVKPGGFVAYGSPALKRRSWISRTASALKTPFMLALHVVFPLSIIVSWLLFPLWFEPLHNIAWGPINPTNLACIAGILHILAFIAPAAMTIATMMVRFVGTPGGEDGHWWWDPPKKD